MTKPSHEHGFQDNLQPLVTVKSQVMPMPKPAKPSHGHGSQEVHNLQPLDTDDNMLIAKRSKPSTKIKKRIKCDLSNMTTSNSSSLVYKCKKCWRKYPLKSHVALHRLATHKNKEHKTPLLCLTVSIYR